MSKGDKDIRLFGQRAGRMLRAGKKLLVIAVLLLFAMVSAATAEPKRVLLLHSFGRDFSPWSEVARNLRTEIQRQSPEFIEFHDAALATERFGGGQDERPFVNYLQTYFVDRRLDLIVAIGAPAARFVQQHRQQLFPSTPMLFTAVEQRRVSLTTLTENDTVVAIVNDFDGMIQNILRVLPETTDIVMIVGNSPNEQYWVEQIRNAAPSYTNRVTFTWYNDLSFNEMLKRAAALPTKSAIFYFLLSVDAAGVSHEGGKALADLRAVARAPIFNGLDADFGDGIVGGPLVSMKDLARQAASVAVRILNGEKPSEIKTPPIVGATPKFDWRELQRWNISEANLPPGSEVHFRTPTMWEQYRWQLAATFALVLFQAAMIAGLLMERRRRSLAELEAGNRRREVIHLNRAATATVLSSSIAHELSQPLGAILLNVETAQQLLGAVPPNLRLVGEILSDIGRDERRAAEIIHRQQALLKKGKGTELQVFDLNDSVREVMDIALPEATKRGVALRAGTSEMLLVHADRIQMQQVLLNLVMNGMDAVEDCDSAARELTILTSCSAGIVAEVTVSDSGKGIPTDKLESIFDAFFTTKPRGTGLGLPIARTIIETYGGAIWAENRAGGGAAFHFTLPLVEANPA